MKNYQTMDQEMEEMQQIIDKLQKEIHLERQSKDDINQQVLTANTKISQLQEKI